MQLGGEQCCVYVRRIELSRSRRFLYMATASYILSMMILYAIRYSIKSILVMLVISVLYIIELIYFMHDFNLSYKSLCKGLCMYCGNVRFDRHLGAYICSRDNLIICYNKISYRVFIFKVIREYKRYNLSSSKVNFSCLKFLGGELSYGEVNVYKGRALYPDMGGNTFVEGDVLVYFSDVKPRELKREGLIKVMEKIFAKMGV
ncbi:MAG: hypothetical protein GSR85_07295 [Desulfurococcales archaeon]|nr:hypothetical protein [Desulfurococcales archaeon]